MDSYNDVDIRKRVKTLTVFSDLQIKNHKHYITFKKRHVFSHLNSLGSRNAIGKNFLDKKFTQKVLQNVHFF